MTRGLLPGRFLPPHAGHQYLIDTALALVDRLTIVVHDRPDDAIPAATRCAWLGEMAPRAGILAIDGEAMDAATLAAALGPEPIALLFADAGSGAALAGALGATLVDVDPDRATIPITSAAIRADPFGQWRHIPAAVRPHYARSICLHGPESTGKSTLAPKLAAHFGTILVPEYGRTYCEQHGLDLTMADLVAIGRAHAAMTAAALRQCDRRLILDTDPLMTAAWADMLFGARDPWFDAFGATADLYLLLDIDLPWVDDGTRFFGDDARRRRFLDLSRAELDRRQLPYAVIGGPHEERFDRALAAIAAAGLA